MPVLFLTPNYKILNFLETATLFSLSSLKSPFMKKRWEEKNQWSQFSCWFTQQFHEEQSAEAYSLWRRNNKAKEGCVPLRINQRATWRGSRFVCTTSLEHKELNKWSHDQDKSEVEIQQTGSQKAASYQGNSYSLASITTFTQKFLKPAQACKSLGESANSVHHVLPWLNVLFSNTDPHLRLHVTRHHSPQKASINPFTSSLSFQPLYLHIRIIPPDFDIPLG